MYRSRISVFILIVWSSGVSTDPFYPEGCKFEKNKSYALKVPLGKAGYGSYYGTDFAEDGLHMENKWETDAFVEMVTDIYSRAMGSSTLKSIDYYIDFYDAYLKRKQGTNFNTFFEDYSPIFRPKEDAAGIVIDILEQISNSYVLPPNKNFRIKNFSHLVTCSHDDMDLVDVEPYGTKVPKNFVHDHVAGLVLLTLRHTETYIILDPGHGVNKPIVVTEDRSPKWGVDFIDGANFKYTHIANMETNPDPNNYRYRNPVDKNYIVAKPNDQFYGTNKRGRVYYINRPFCSFLDTTTKRNLLSPIQSMIARTHTGDVTAEIKVTLETEADKTNKAKVEIREKGDKQAFNIDLLQHHQMSSDQRSKFVEVCKTLRVQVKDMESKLSRLAEISKDSAFLSGCKGMLKFLTPPEVGYDISIEEEKATQIEEPTIIEKPKSHILGKIKKKVKGMSSCMNSENENSKP